MARSLRIRPQAALDIDDHTEYLAFHAGERVAERFTANLTTTLGNVADHPELGSPWESEQASLRGMRFWLVRRFKSHVVFYRLSDETIEIVRVLHLSTDLESGLLEIDE